VDGDNVSRLGQLRRPLDGTKGGGFGAAGQVSDAPFASPIVNFYMTCPISRSSRTMAECVASRAQLLAAE